MWSAFDSASMGEWDAKSYRKGTERWRATDQLQCVVLNATVMRFCTLLWRCPSAETTISSIYKLRCNFCCKWLKRHLLLWHSVFIFFSFFFRRFNMVLFFLSSCTHAFKGGKSSMLLLLRLISTARDMLLCWILLHAFAFVVAFLISNSVFICCRCDLIRWFEGMKFHKISYKQRSAEIYSIHSSPHDVFCSN